MDHDIRGSRRHAVSFRLKNLHYTRIHPLILKFQQQQQKGRRVKSGETSTNTFCGAGVIREK